MIAAARHTWRNGAEQWVRSRLEALQYALTRRGLPLELALPVARAVVGKWWIETGAGEAEYDFNAGNLTAYGKPDPPDVRGWHGAVTARPNGRRFRAYADLDDAVEDYVQLMEGSRGPASGEWHGRYADAWRYLLTHPTEGREWYRRILADGYTEGNAQTFAELLNLYDTSQNLIAQHLGPGARADGK